MKKKYVTLVVIIISFIALLFGIHTKGDTKLDNVKLNEQIDKSMFAIMIEQEDGKYQESSDNEWPGDGYTFNSTLSGCMDINGDKIEEEGILTFINNKATVDTSKTAYCYLYFDKNKNS